MPPQQNATVTAVKTATAATGGRDDWDTPGVEPTGAGVSKWAGTIRGYYREKVQRVNDRAGETSVSVIRTLWLDTDDVLRALLDTDDVVTFTLDPIIGGTTINARVVLIARAALEGIPRRLQTTRLDIEPT